MESANMTTETFGPMLIEQKMTVFNMMGSVCMTWWVSTVLLSAAIFGTVWSEAKALMEQKALLWLVGLLVLTFLGSVIAFGYTVLNLYLVPARVEMRELALRTTGNKDAFVTEFRVFHRGMIIGTLNFALFLAGWVCFWLWLYSQAK